jgi:ArsR family transcriptional regulator
VPTVTDSSKSVALFHALSDETRLSIMEMLQGGERCVCELQDELSAAQSRLSFHLKVLKDAGFLLDRKEGRWVYYTLNPQAFVEAAEALAEMKPSRRALPVRTSSGCC